MAADVRFRQEEVVTNESTAGSNRKPRFAWPRGSRRPLRGLLTMRVRPHPEQRPLGRVSKDEATLKNGWLRYVGI
jgi:hypothetical protein